jgi:MFS transporter, PAT family, beta-lactamase induction signal transducer AmpG
VTAGATPRKTTTRDVLRALRRPKVLAMLLLGFSSGLPLYLVGNTMGYWMREGGSELSAIGFLSWVGLAYTLKFLWAPVIDKTHVPLLGRLGHRRGWMLLSQVIVAAGLAGMAIVQPEGGLLVFGILALLAAFASATQDIVIDAWRIEIADDKEELGLLTSGTQFGYRTALLVTDALILILATHIGWAPSYWVMAALMGVGVLAALFLAREPNTIRAPEVAIDVANEASGVSDAMVVRWLAAALVGVTAITWMVLLHAVWDMPWELRDLAYVAGVPTVIWLLVRRTASQAPLRAATWSRPLVVPLLRFFEAVIGPLLAFVKTHGKWALLMLAAISLYRLPDFVMGPMNNPFYADIGISKDFVGEVRATIGLAAALLGITAAGISAVRFGFVPTLLAGAILGPGSNAAFTWVAYSGGDHGVFAAAMFIDGFSTGFAGTALVAYMSSLTSVGYTATQYALLSSFYALLGKLLKGLSGVAVEYLQVGHGEIGGYALFFLGTALTGIPALLLCLLLARRIRGATDA